MNHILPTVFNLTRYAHNLTFTGAVNETIWLKGLSKESRAKLRRKIPESPWGTPIPVGDGDGDVKRFPDGDGGEDGDGVEKRDEMEI
ncbi:hypothetical protein Tco_0743250 [Tanacetum coccineum]